MLGIKEPLFPSALGKNFFNYFNGYYERSNFGDFFVTHALVSFSTYLGKFWNKGYSVEVMLKSPKIWKISRPKSMVALEDNAYLL